MLEQDIPVEFLIQPPNDTMEMIGNMGGKGTS
jgi:hypothetical protein